MSAFLAAILEKIGYDAISALIAKISSFIAARNKDKAQKATDADNTKKLDEAVKTDDLEKKARAAEDVWNG